jgi:hypothetical protein
MTSLVRCILRCVRCRNAGLISENFAKPVVKIVVGDPDSQVRGVSGAEGLARLGMHVS